MKLEAGKKYVLRNGDTEKCLAIWCEPIEGYQATVTCGFTCRAASYTIDGEFFADGTESDFDIVAEYKEPVRVADYFEVYAHTPGCGLYCKETYPIGQQPEGAVLIPGSERDGG